MTRPVVVHSHPRAGSHWFAALLERNYGSDCDHFGWYGGHPWPDTSRVRHDSSRRMVVYIHRNLEATARSIYTMRSRFGLHTGTYNACLYTPLRHLWRGNLRVRVKRVGLDPANVEVFTSVDSLFRGDSRTLAQWLADHVTAWKATAHYVVTYEQLQEDWKGVLHRIGRVAGLTPRYKTFQPVTHRVGWQVDELKE